MRNPEQQKKMSDVQRLRYQSDPEFKKLINQRSANWKDKAFRDGLCTCCGNRREEDSPNKNYCISCNTKHRNRIRKRFRERLEIVFAYYGEKCACPGGCDITHRRFLTLDHVGGWRAVHPGHEKRITTEVLVKWIIDNNFPDSIRILCMNCNWAVRSGEPCPHEIINSEGTKSA